MTASATSIVESMATAWKAGDVGRVLALAAQVSGADADDARFLALLGMAQMQSGDHAPAARTFERLVRMQPDVSAWRNNLGEACRQAGDLAAAERALVQAQSLAPNDPEVFFNLGLLYIQQRRWPAAREVLLDAVRFAPQFVEARLQAAHACHVCGDSDGEEAMLDGADGWPPQPAEQALVLGAILSAQGRLETALKVLAQARLPEGPSAAPLRLRITAQRAALYERNNLLEQAKRELQRLSLAELDAVQADADRARIDGWRVHAVMAAREGRHADAAVLYRRVLDVASDPESRANAAFGLAAALDRQSRPHEAWQALEAAHDTQRELVRETTPELLAPDSQPLPMATRSVDAHARATWKSVAGPSMRQSPVFVIGFPRSGTTLLEQMLAAHPDFRSMDERGYVYELIERMERAGQRYTQDLADLTQEDADQLREIYWRLVGGVLPDLGGHRLVDKNPLNMLCLPMILRLFPATRIVLCLRHPCDVLLSCSMQSFRSPAFMAMCSSLPRLARGYSDAFAQCCRHIDLFEPQVLEWRYEDVVGDFEASVARLGKFLSVEDASPMTDFAAHSRDRRFISTPSYARVMQPVSNAAVGHWLAYREQFEPVLPMLRPWMERFDYVA